jgi:nicotinamidase-related amidase
MDDVEHVYSEKLRDPKGMYIVEFDIVSCSTALLIIDLQKYMCCRDIGLGPVYLRETPELAERWFCRLDEVVIPNVQKLLSFFRRNKLRIAFACVGPLLPDASDMSPRRRIRDFRRLEKAGIDHFFYPGTLEHEIINELKPIEDEIIFNKNTSSVFNSTNINLILKNLGIDSLIITGMTTSSCVESSARDAADLGYNCILVDDACADKHKDAHEMTMVNFDRANGKVMNTREVIEYLKTRFNRSR